MKSTNYPTWDKMLFESDEQKTERLKAERLAKIENLARQATIRYRSDDLFLNLLKQAK